VVHIQGKQRWCAKRRNSFNTWLSAMIFSEGPLSYNLSGEDSHPSYRRPSFNTISYITALIFFLVYLMTFAESFLPEFDHEMAGARSILALVPDRLLTWKAHQSLNSIGWVASHIADTLSWVELTLKETSFDVAPVNGPKHETPILESTKAILASFDENLATSRPMIEAATDEELLVPFTLLEGGQELFTTPRMALVKSLFINHIVHHRAFLVAYLRMNGVECPGLYG